MSDRLWISTPCQSIGLNTFRFFFSNVFLCAILDFDKFGCAEVWGSARPFWLWSFRYRYGASCIGFSQRAKQGALFEFVYFCQRKLNWFSPTPFLSRFFSPRTTSLTQALTIWPMSFVNLYHPFAALILSTTRCEFLGACLWLFDLYLKIGDAGVQSIASALKTNNGLHRLNLANNRLSAFFLNVVACPCFASFFRHYESTSIKRLVNRLFQYTPAPTHTHHPGSVGAAALTHALQVNSTLRVLDLRYNLLLDAGAAALAIGMPKYRGLVELHLGAALNDPCAPSLPPNHPQPSPVRTKNKTTRAQHTCAIELTLYSDVSR